MGIYSNTLQCLNCLEWHFYEFINTSLVKIIDIWILSLYHKRPIFFKRHFQMLIILEHENLSKVSKYIGKGLSIKLYGYFYLISTPKFLGFFCKRNLENLVEKMGLYAIYILKWLLKNYDIHNSNKRSLCLLLMLLTVKNRLHLLLHL